MNEESEVAVAVESAREKVEVYSPLHETESVIGQIIGIAVRIGPRIESFLISNEEGSLVRTNNFDEIGQFNDKMEASAKEQDIPIKSIVNGILNLARLNVLDDDKNERLSLVLVSQVIKTTFLETDHIYM